MVSTDMGRLRSPKKQFRKDKAAATSDQLEAEVALSNEFASLAALRAPSDESSILAALMAPSTESTSLAALMAPSNESACLVPLMASSDDSTGGGVVQTEDLTYPVT